jgi:anti-anti-sigma factor
MKNEQSDHTYAVADAEWNGGSEPFFSLDESPVGSSSLESQRIGLLASPRAPIDTDRRLEEWIASNLEWNETIAPKRSPWIRLIDGLPGLKRPSPVRRRESGTETPLLGWNHFHVAYRRGITVVRLTESSLVKEAQVRDFACDLLDLIEAGNYRIVINFQAVERLASWVVVAVEKAKRLCESVDGGALKICGLPRPLASVFPIVGVALGKALHGDENSAVDGPWPEHGTPRTLPIEILAEITRVAPIPPVKGGAPAQCDSVQRAAPSKIREGSATGLDGLWLNVQIGGSRGQSVAISGSRFLIGRDGTCGLRLASPLVSKVHAAIESTPAGIVIHDLGSTNGTIHNGRVLRAELAVLNEGDRIQIGPIVATLAVGQPKVESTRVDELVDGWLNREGTVPAPGHDAPPTAEQGAFDPAATVTQADEPKIKDEMIQDVIVITPKVTEFDDEDSIELLRSHLNVRFQQSATRRMVVNLECVRHLNAQAIGVLLAHHLRLDRSGGALRICQAHPRLMALLHNVRLTMLVEFHPTLDEAVLAAWPSSPNRTAGEV